MHDKNRAAPAATGMIGSDRMALNFGGGATLHEVASMFEVGAWIRRHSKGQSIGPFNWNE